MPQRRAASIAPRRAVTVPPRRAASKAPPPTAQDPVSIFPRRKKLLLVDDDPAQLKLGKIRLERAGYLVETAVSAQQALRKAKREAPDVIVSDVLMSELDGFGLCRRVREDKQLSSVPVILLSAHYDSAQDQELAQKVGASGLVPRTPNFDAAIRALRETIDSDCPPSSQVDTALYEQHLRTHANQINRLLTQTQAAEEKYRMLIERIPDAIWTCDAEGTFTFITRNIVDILGYTPEEMMSETLESRKDKIHPDDRAMALSAFREHLEHGTPYDVEYRRQRKDDRWIWVRNRVTASYEQGGVRCIEGMLSDVTERRQLESSLRQAQKMEAVGQLTGGIAHDFNNILSTIIVNAHFLMNDIANDDPRWADAEAIKTAADRAAALTRQLLAFSRRQVLEPTVVNLNTAVRGLEKMLRRLIGEDIDFSVIPEARLGATRVDLSQLEQVIMNLVVNARDAMPTGGKLLIETANVELDEQYRDRHAVVPAGNYVMLAVSDTGFGMDEQTQLRVFEPFFTTKPQGKGTGLGLSTCYGIVKQSGGYIWVYSEPGYGTVFKVYLPRVDDQPAPIIRASMARKLNGVETILLVEDDAQVRAGAARILRGQGYKVLDACDGTHAVAIAAAQTGTIDMVLSDVVMPGTNGPEVVAQLKLRFPKLKSLFMSGYSDHAVLANGALQAGVNFIQKPFVPRTLSRRVREVLDQP
jgi:PAS domain S-box-containing protein